MVTPTFRVAGLALLSLGLLAGCGRAEAEDVAGAVGGEWPPSAIEAPKLEALDEGEVVVAGDSAESPGSVASRDGMALRAGERAGGRGVGPMADEGDPLPVRPRMDLDASGPMIHPPPRAAADFPDARFPRPDHVRGLYVNAWAAGSSRRMDAILDLARRTEVNALVIDIKDATGFVSHRTQVPLAHEIGATGEVRISDLPALLDRLEAEGIYPIARIVVVKDPILARFRPEFAVQDTAGGVWIDSKQIIWLNPYAQGVWDYHIEIAREVAQMGFPEIQWDYIRFPDVPEADMQRAVFEGSEGKDRADAIRGFLTSAREGLADLPVRSTADVFGVTTTFRRDVGIGQLWEKFIDVVDVALPMVYPSHYWENSYGYDRPNAYPYEIVQAALRDALRRSAAVEGAGSTRPWIQDFTLGVPAYGAPEVRAQIQAAYDVGIQEWVLWNPGSRYTESALEPNDGFATEPLMRVAGVVSPVSRRYLVMDSMATLPAKADTLEDSAWPRVPDTLPVDTLAPNAPVVDTLPPAPAVDTLPADTPPVDMLSRKYTSRRRAAGTDVRRWRR